MDEIKCEELGVKFDSCGDTWFIDVGNSPMNTRVFKNGEDVSSSVKSISMNIDANKTSPVIKIELYTSEEQEIIEI